MPAPSETPYVADVIADLAARTGLTDPALLRLYALLVFSKGWETTLEDVHDAWSLWRMESDPGHRSLIPFDQLTPEVQELDRAYMEAIHEVAANRLANR